MATNPYLSRRKHVDQPRPHSYHARNWSVTDNWCILMLTLQSSKQRSMGLEHAGRGPISAEKIGSSATREHAARCLSECGEWHGLGTQDDTHNWFHYSDSNGFPYLPFQKIGAWRTGLYLWAQTEPSRPSFKWGNERTIPSFPFHLGSHLKGLDKFGWLQRFAVQLKKIDGRFFERLFFWLTNT